MIPQLTVYGLFSKSNGPNRYSVLDDTYEISSYSESLSAVENSGTGDSLFWCAAYHEKQTCPFLLLILLLRISPPVQKNQTSLPSPGTRGQEPSIHSLDLAAPLLKRLR